MAAAPDFLPQLDAALATRREYLEGQVVPSIRSDLRSMRSSFEAIHTLLQKMSLLKPDPYKYEERLSDLDVPPDKPFLDSERDSVLSIRLGQFQSRMEYVTEYFDFSFEALTLIQLKKLIKFVKFINWRNLSDTAAQPTTRGLAELVIKIRGGGDQLSINIAKDAQEQLNQIAGRLNDGIKAVTSWQREYYKYRIRAEVLPALSLPEPLDQSQYEKAAKSIKSALPKQAPGLPFARELVFEIFAENSPDGGEASRDALLREIGSVPEKKKSSKGHDLKPLLFEATRALAQSSRSLDEIARKMGDNAIVLESRKASFGEILRQIWDRMRGEDEQQQTYTVEFVDDQTGQRRTEDIVFEQWTAGITRRARLYGGLFARQGSSWTKLQASNADQMLAFINKEIGELLLIVRRAESLDTYFRTEVERERRSQLRGINIEATAISENVQRARGKSREYVSRTEEIEQLRKLGITE